MNLRCPGLATLFATAIACVRATEIPRARIDVDVALPAVLVPLGAGIRATASSGGVSARAVARNGFGGGVMFAGAGEIDPLGSDRPSVQTAHAEGWIVDLVAIYRARPYGDDRRGLGVDLALGLSTANLQWDPGYSAVRSNCGSIYVGQPCTTVVTEPYTPPPTSFSNGPRLGPVIAVRVDGRHRALVYGFSLSYRALVYDGQRPIAAEPVALSVLTVAAHIGVGFAP